MALEKMKDLLVDFSATRIISSNRFSAILLFIANIAHHAWPVDTAVAVAVCCQPLRE